jgi:phage tail-like protein
MPGSSRHDPYRNFNFRVEIDGIASSSFSEVVFPDSTIGVVEYREGGDKTSSSRKLPGRVHYSNVVLRRGVSQSADLWNWWNTVRNGTPDRRSGVIVLLDTDLTEVRRWSFTGAWPCRYDVSPLAGRGEETVIETLELAVESFSLET